MLNKNTLQKLTVEIKQIDKFHKKLKIDVNKTIKALQMYIVQSSNV